MQMGWAEILVWYAVFVFSITIHEMAHALVAWLGGDDMAYWAGQITLNPVPYMRREPIGMIMLPILSLFLIQWPFGYASTPYDPFWAFRYPRRAARMAAAGPLANLLVAILVGGLLRVGLATRLFVLPDRIRLGVLVAAPGNALVVGFASFLSIVFTLNLLLAVLNLLPIPPLDGSQLVLLFLREEGVRRYQSLMAHPLLGFVGLILAWQLVTPLFSAVFFLATRCLYWGYL